MEHYNRAYRDPQSPLTPLTPLSSQNSFSFNIDGDNSLHTCIKNTELYTPNALQFTTNFCKRKHEGQQKNIFEKAARPCRIKIIRTDCGGGDGGKLSSNEPNSRKPHICNKMPSLNNSSISLLHSIVRSEPNCCYFRKCTSVDSQHQSACKKRSDFRKSSPVPPKALDARIDALLIKTNMTKYRKLFHEEEIDVDIFGVFTLRDLFMLGIKESADQKQLLLAVQLAQKYVQTAVDY